MKFRAVNIIVTFCDRDKLENKSWILINSPIVSSNQIKTGNVKVIYPLRR